MIREYIPETKHWTYVKGGFPNEAKAQAWLDEKVKTKLVEKDVDPIGW